MPCILDLLYHLLFHGIVTQANTNSYVVPEQQQLVEGTLISWKLQTNKGQNTQEFPLIISTSYYAGKLNELMLNP